uniref:Uncharacterized protein n=1 Tax=Glossina austeni TaxID=7395 RepID=A0A1A9V4V3_GLOAU
MWDYEDDSNNNDDNDDDDEGDDDDNNDNNDDDAYRFNDYYPRQHFRLKFVFLKFKMPTVAEESIDAFQNYYARPPERPKKRSFRQMLYDPETKSYFGRSVESWVLIADNSLLPIIVCGLIIIQLAPIAYYRPLPIIVSCRLSLTGILPTMTYISSCRLAITIYCL